MRILLINPPPTHAAKIPAPTTYVHVHVLPPLGLLYLTAALREAGHEVMLIDAALPDMDWAATAARIRRFQPRLAGMTAYTFLFYDTLQTARWLRSLLPGVKIVLGGPHTSVYPEETLTHDEIDFLIAGDGENALVRLVNALESKEPFHEVAGLWYRNEKGKPVSVPPDPPRLDLDAVDFPDRTGQKKKAYHSRIDTKGFETSLITSRGCPFRCRYCGDVLEKGFRARSAANVIAEMEQIAAQGFAAVQFWDGTFNLDLDRAKEICRGLIQRNLPLRFSTRIRGDITDEELFSLLAQAKCDRVNIGVESANAEILLAMERNIDLRQVARSITWARQNGIRTHAYYMLGFPGETRQQIENTIELAMTLKTDYAMFSPVMLVPGTRLFQDELDRGNLKTDPYREYTLTPSPEFFVRLPQPEVPPQQVLQLVRQAYRRFYFTPEFLLREATRPGKLIEKAALGVELLAYQLGKTWHS